jgi:hypothetical protein
MPNESLVESFFKLGIGEYFFLHTKENQIIFGHLVYEKGRIYMRDNGLLSLLNPETLLGKRSDWYVM